MRELLAKAVRATGNGSVSIANGDSLRELQQLAARTLIDKPVSIANGDSLRELLLERMGYDDAQSLFQSRMAIL